MNSSSSIIHEHLIMRLFMKKKKITTIIVSSRRRTATVPAPTTTPREEQSKFGSAGPSPPTTLAVPSFVSRAQPPQQPTNQHLRLCFGKQPPLPGTVARRPRALFPHPIIGSGQLGLLAQDLLRAGGRVRLGLLPLAALAAAAGRQRGARLLQEGLQHLLVLEDVARPPLRVQGAHGLPALLLGRHQVDLEGHLHGGAPALSRWGKVGLHLALVSLLHKVLGTHLPANTLQGGDHVFGGVGGEVHVRLVQVLGEQRGDQGAQLAVRGPGEHVGPAAGSPGGLLRPRARLLGLLGGRHPIRARLHLLLDLRGRERRALEPGVPLQLLDGRALLGVHLEDPADEVLELLAEVGVRAQVGRPETVVAVGLAGVEPPVVVHRHLEGRVACGHDEQHHARRPDVRLGPGVPLVGQHLGAHVGLRPALRLQELLVLRAVRHGRRRQPKVRQAQLGLGVQEEVLGLQVPVVHALQVAGLQRPQELRKVRAAEVLAEGASVH
mmetsp:Transcript_1634/g.2886  ORF Transcript_1634/g.2886 Transcript_1634/m.2886 type:complete len:494 (-) Transcript_1634:579-2060(-)